MHGGMHGAKTNCSATEGVRTYPYACEEWFSVGNIMLSDRARLAAWKFFHHCTLTHADFVALLSCVLARWLPAFEKLYHLSCIDTTVQP